MFVLLFALKALIFLVLYLTWFAATCWSIGILEGLTGTPAEGRRALLLAAALWPFSLPAAAVAMFLYVAANTFGKRGAVTGSRIRAQVKEVISEASN